MGRNNIVISDILNTKESENNFPIADWLCNRSQTRSHDTLNSNTQQNLNKDQQQGYNANFHDGSNASPTIKIPSINQLYTKLQIPYCNRSYLEQLHQPYSIVNNNSILNNAVYYTSEIYCKSNSRHKIHEQVHNVHCSSFPPSAYNFVYPHVSAKPVEEVNTMLIHRDNTSLNIQQRFPQSLQQKDEPQTQCDLIKCPRKKRDPQKPWLNTERFIISNTKKRFRQGRVFNCPDCGDYYNKNGHSNNSFYHYACCELCGKSKNHWKVRDIYFCTCRDSACHCPKGKHGVCKRGICGVCLFDKSNCIAKMMGTKTDPNNDRKYPGPASFKRYIQSRFTPTELKKLEGFIDFNKDNYEWQLCCQCIAFRLGIEYGELCPCSYHKSVKS